MSKFWAGLIIAILVIILGAIIFFTAVPAGREIWNTYQHGLQKADDNTLYETRKHVEDSCRSMMASYQSDKLTWLQYKDSENTEQQSWANQAKMRANRTAATYNEYVLKNSYVWDGNIPADIDVRLDYLE